jgi:hypothetical protein
LILRDVEISTHMGRKYFIGVPVVEGSDASEWLIEVTRNGMILDFQRVLPSMNKTFSTPQVMIDYGHAYFIPPRTRDGKSTRSVISK